MLDNIEEYIIKFNENNEDFGKVDINIIKSNNKDGQLLFFFFPMIERLIRNILQNQPNSDLEHIEKYTFKSFFSIVEQNNELLNDLFCDGSEDEGEENEILYYLKYAYNKKGPRNIVMHHVEGAEVDVQEIFNAKYIFERLIVFYVDNYC